MLKKIPLILILLLSALVILPFFQSGLPATHDGIWVPVRLAEMIRELKDLQIPPRMSGYLNHGYGYPLFNFTYPFPYYLGAALYFLGFGLVDSIKIIFALTVPLSGIFMYLLAKEVWRSKLAGLISAALYIFLPYRIVDLYARGSIGESLSFILFPLIIYFAIKKHTLLLAISIAVLITTHNIMAVLFLPILIILVPSLYLLVPIVLGLGLSAFFWVPALWEKNNIALSKIPIADRSLYFVKPLELIIPKWGYGLPTNPDGFGYQIGIPQIIATFAATALTIIKNSRLPIILICLICLMVFLMFPISAPLWQLPILKEINYPWTLLAPIGFLISLLAGYLVTNNLAKILAVTLSFGAVVFCLPHSVPQSFNNYPDDYYRTNDATTTSSDELMPLWVKEKPTSRQAPNKNLKPLSDASNKLVYQVNLKINTKIKINKIYYPGWKWNVPWYENSGLMELTLKKGSYVIEGNFTETPLRQLANITSLFSLLTLGVLWSKRFSRWLLKH